MQRRNPRKPQWVVPEEVYGPKHYPPYCNGPAYAMNRKAARCILHGEVKLRSFQKEIRETEKEEREIGEGGERNREREKEREKEKRKDIEKSRR